MHTAWTSAFSAAKAAHRPAAPSALVQHQETNVDRPEVGLWKQPLPQRKPTKKPPAEPRTRAIRETADERRQAAYWQRRTMPAEATETTFRHSHWGPRRAKVLESFQRLNLNEFRVDHFENCGSGCIVQASKSTGKIRLSANYCHDRFCLACGQTRSRLIAANIERYIDKRECRFLTLTLKHSKTSLREQIKRLQHSFRKLRQSTLWRNCVTGGAAFLEVKRSKSGAHWHPHMHVLIEGTFLSQPLLSAQWLLVTGDSNIVDIRFVRDGTAVVRYVAKYAAKPIDSTLFEEPAWLDESIQSLHGTRLCTTFGKWRGIELEAKPADPGDWVPLCSLKDLVARASEGDEPSAALLKLIREGKTDHEERTDSS
jgi:hypothetical protein